MTKKEILENMIRRVIREETSYSDISSYIRKLQKNFNLTKYNSNSLQLNSKSDIRTIQDYFRKNGWIQSKNKKDEWFNTNLGFRANLSSIHGILAIHLV